MDQPSADVIRKALSDAAASAATTRRPVASSIVNACDGAVGHSDHVLNRAIDSLQRQTNRVDAVTLFISDHGESLGAKGVSMACPPTSHRPSKRRCHFGRGCRTLREYGLVNGDCLLRYMDKLSQDNLWHSVLGLTGTRAAHYRSSLDMLIRCHANAASRTPL